MILPFRRDHALTSEVYVGVVVAALEQLFHGKRDGRHAVFRMVTIAKGYVQDSDTSFFFFLLKTKKAGVFIAENPGLVCSSEMWFVIKILQIAEVDSYQIINVSTLVE